MELKIKNNNIKIDVFRFENNKTDKHKHIGYVSLTIDELVKIKSIKLMENTETQTYWLGFPQEKSKGKWQSILMMSKEDKQAIVDVIANKTPEQQSATIDDMPWDLEDL